MKDYKELSKQLRYCGDVGKCQSCEFYRKTEPCSQNLLGEAADAIEELLESSLNFEELWQQSMEMREELQTRLDKINSLTHNGYYTGTYIQSLIESEERSSDWKDEESVTFFPANKEVE